MRCTKARAYIDLRSGGLDTQRETKLQEHLTSCASCRLYQSQDAVLSAAIGTAPSVELPAWIHARIMDSSRQHDTSRVRIKHLGRWQAVPTLAAIALSLYLGGLVGSKSFTNNSTLAATAPFSQLQNSEYASFGESSLLESVDTDGEYDE